jgi:hypothetical protein
METFSNVSPARKSVPARLLLTQTLMAMKKVHPEILPDFRDKLALLQKEKPLSEPAQAVVQRLLNEVLGDAGNGK